MTRIGDNVDFEFHFGARYGYSDIGVLIMKVDQFFILIPTVSDTLVVRDESLLHQSVGHGNVSRFLCESGHVRKVVIVLTGSVLLLLRVW